MIIKISGINFFIIYIQITFILYKLRMHIVVYNKYTP